MAMRQSNLLLQNTKNSYNVASLQKISDSAKLLYGLMLDRMSLSIRNGWLDDDNRAYIFFTTNDVMEQMCCGTEKATKCLQNLIVKRYRTY